MIRVAAMVIMSVVTVVMVVILAIAPGGSLRAGPVEGHRPALAPDVQRTGTSGESAGVGKAMRTVRSLPRTWVTHERIISLHVAGAERRWTWLDHPNVLVTSESRMITMDEYVEDGRFGG